MDMAEGLEGVGDQEILQKRISAEVYLLFAGKEHAAPR
jgi:hypothetical protein